MIRYGQQSLAVKWWSVWDIVLTGCEIIAVKSLKKRPLELWFDDVKKIINDCTFKNNLFIIH